MHQSCCFRGTSTKVLCVAGIGSLSGSSTAMGQEASFGNAGAPAVYHLRRLLPPAAFMSLGSCGPWSMGPFFMSPFLESTGGG